MPSEGERIPRPAPACPVPPRPAPAWGLPSAQRAVPLHQGRRRAVQAGHLGALVLPPGLRHLYIARDADPAGERGAAILRRRAEAAGIPVTDLIPREDDFNRDLCHLGPRDLALHLAPQLDPNDAVAHLTFEEAVA